MRLKYRPMAVMGFSVLLIMFLCLFADRRVAVVSIALGALLLVVSLSIKKIRESVFPLFLAGALLLSGFIFKAAEIDYKNAAKFAGKEAAIVGVITDSPEYYNSRYYYVLKTKEIGGSEISTKLRLSLPYELDAEPYDTIALNAKVYLMGSGSDEVALRYKAKGIFIGAYAYNTEDYKVQVDKHTGTPLGLRLINIRDEIKLRIFDMLPNEYGGVVIGLLLGDKSFISSETISNFREIGVAPLFAVSGLHLSVWVMGLYGLLEQLKVKKRINSIIGIVFTLVFMAITGFTGSVCRSGLMMILLLAGNLFYRRSDSVNSLGFAALLLCIINPFIGADVGFLLSFSATLGIVSLYPIINKRILSRVSDNVFGKILKSVFSLIIVCICAVIGSLPITILFIKNISVISVLSNLLLNYAATLCMLFGGFAALFTGVGFIADVFGIVAGLLSKYIIYISSSLAALPVTTLNTYGIFWKIGVILSLAVLSFSLLCFKGKSLVKAVCIGLVFVITGCSVASYLHFDSLTQVQVLNVENGCCVVASNGKNKIVLGCDAEYYFTADTISESLNQISGRSTNLLIIPNSKSINSEKTIALFNEQEFNKVIIPEESKTISSLTSEDNIIVQNNLKINVWDDSEIDYLSTSDYSIAFCNFDSKTILIIFNCQKYANIPNEYSKADFLICNSFIPYSLDVTGFGRVIISSESNIAEPIATYVRSKGVRTMTTAKYGNININIKNGDTKIKVQED
jgi:competence protein ComEC